MIPRDCSQFPLSTSPETPRNPFHSRAPDESSSCLQRFLWLHLIERPLRVHVARGIELPTGEASRLRQLLRSPRILVFPIRFNYEQRVPLGARVP